MKNKLRYLWHEFFYGVAPEALQDFAMTCKEATGQINLQSNQVRLLDRVRLRLHLSLCQACTNYFRTGRVLREALRNLMGDSETLDSEILDKELLRKYARSSVDKG